MTYLLRQVSAIPGVVVGKSSGADSDGTSGGGGGDNGGGSAEES